MATINLTIKTSKDPNRFKRTNSDQENLQHLINLLSGISIGALQGTVDIQGSSADPVAAAGTATITYASIAANDTMVVGQTTFTCKASGANGTTEFNKVTDATATAAALAAAINANTTTSKYVVATSALGVVTITSLVKGVIGNAIVLAKTGTGIALVQPTGGAGGATDTAVTVAR